MLYLDYAATTPVNQEVQETYAKIIHEHFGNADSLHQLGLEASSLMERSRSLIASLLKVATNEVIFTSGASEANNLAIKGVAFQYQKRGKHLITTSVEHSSVYETCKQLEESFGFEVTYLKVNQDGELSLEELEKAIRSDTILVSIMHVNNEVGMIYPIEEIKKITKKYPNVHLHVDMVQALGKIPIDLTDIDLASFSAHKIYGLKGSGILVKKNSTQLLPLITGGQQEFNLRAGTSNVPTNIVLAKTIRLALEDLDKKSEHVRMLNQMLRNYFLNLEHAHINSPINASPYIVNVSLLDYKPETLIHALEELGIYISTKSACTTKKNTISRTLKAMNSSDAIGNAALRISLSHTMKEADIEYFTTSLDGVLESIKKQR